MRTTAGAREWAGLAVLALPCLLVSLDAEVLNMAAPQLATDLRPSAVQLLWIMDSYVFVVAGALIAMGVLGDRIGRRRLLLAGATAFALSSLLAAFATGPGLLIAARVLMGLAGASLMPSTLALIRTMFADGRQRGIALGVWSASFSLGGLAAPLIGGVMLEHFWWGSVFLLAVPATVLLVLVGPVLLPEARDSNAKGFDVGGAVLSLAAVLIFVYGIKRLAAEGRPALPFLMILAAGAIFALFLRRQRRIARPLLDLSVFGDVRVRVALAANALSFFVLYGTQLAIVQYLQVVLDLSPLRAGLWALPSVGAFLLSSLLGPMLVRWFPAGRVVAAGAVVMATGHAIMALAPFGLGLPALVIGMIVGGLGLAPVYTLTTDLVVSSVRSSRAGMAAAVTETGAELGGALGIAVLGSVVVATYRTGMSGIPGLPADGTLMDAAAAAGRLPASAGTALLHRADDAYGTAFALVSLVAAGLVAVAALLAFRVLWPTAPEPSTAPAATTAPEPSTALAAAPSAAAAAEPMAAAAQAATAQAATAQATTASAAVAREPFAAPPTTASAAVAREPFAAPTTTAPAAAAPEPLATATAAAVAPANAAPAAAPVTTAPVAAAPPPLAAGPAAMTPAAAAEPSDMVGSVSWPRSAGDRERLSSPVIGGRE